MKLPRLLLFLWNMWLKIGHGTGQIMSTIILTILWIVGFGLYAIFWRIAHLIQKKTSAESFWIDSPESTAQNMHYPF